MKPLPGFKLGGRKYSPVIRINRFSVCGTAPDSVLWFTALAIRQAACTARPVRRCRVYVCSDSGTHCLPRTHPGPNSQPSAVKNRALVSGSFRDDPTCGRAELGSDAHPCLFCLKRRVASNTSDRPLAHDDDAVAGRRVDHRVASDDQREQRAMPYQRDGQRESLLAQNHARRRMGADRPPSGSSTEKPPEPDYLVDAETAADVRRQAPRTAMRHRPHPLRHQPRPYRTPRRLDQVAGSWAAIWCRDTDKSGSSPGTRPCRTRTPRRRSR